MDKLATVSADRLREALADASGSKSTLRIVVALEYKDGVPVERIGERYGIPRSTVYTWLDRFEARPVRDAVRDEERPGRPAKLDQDERAELQRAIGGNRPKGSSWTPKTVQQHIEDRFGVRYSLGHARRLLREVDESE